MEMRQDWADSKREEVRSAASVHQLAQWLAATLCDKQEELYAQRVHAEEYEKTLHGQNYAGRGRLTQRV